MSGLNIVSSHRQLSESDLLQAEKEMGTDLPADLRAFYMRNNGGKPDKPLFVAGDEGFLVQCFEPLARDDEPKVNNVVKSYKTWQAVGDTDILRPAVPIAYDAFGNILLYSLDPRSLGAIFAAYHEGGPRSVDRLRFLCSSLAEFLAGLQDRP